MLDVAWQYRFDAAFGEFDTGAESRQCAEHQLGEDFAVVDIAGDALAFAFAEVKMVQLSERPGTDRCAMAHDFALIFD
jgi:hypothetical protein